MEWSLCAGGCAALTMAMARERSDMVAMARGGAARMGEGIRNEGLEPEVFGDDLMPLLLVHFIRAFGLFLSIGPAHSGLFSGPDLELLASPEI